VDAPVEVEFAPTIHGRETVLRDADLAGAIWVEGRVVLPPDTPADEHVVVVADGSPFPKRDLHRAPIGPNGSFRVAFAPETRQGELKLEARYVYLARSSSLFLGKEFGPVVLEPRLGGSIRGRLVLAQSAMDRGSSLVGTGVRFRSRPYKLSKTLEFETSPSPPGWYALTLLAPGVVSIDGDRVQVRSGEVTDATLIVERTCDISGLVVDPVGAPAPGASVRLEWVDSGSSTHSMPSSRRSVHADKAGSFHLFQVEPGSVELQASSPAWSDSESTRVELLSGVPVNNLSLVLRPGGSISGLVRRADGSPAAEIDVRLDTEAGAASWEARGNSKLRARTDGVGSFEFRGLGAGVYGIRAGSQDLELDDIDRHFAGPVAAVDGIRLGEGGSVTDLVLQLADPGRIEGRVIAADGTPPDMAVVWIASSGAFAPNGETTVLAQPSGEFVIKGIAPGKLDLLAQRDHVVSPRAESVIVRSGETSHVELRLVPGTLLYVSVHDEQGREAFREIELDSSNGWKPMVWRIGGSHLPGGLYPEIDPAEPGWQFGPLPPGDYTVRARDAQGKTVEKSVRLAGERTERLILRVEGDR
jgi:hypothetical protein